MRSLTHPGPVATERERSAPCMVRALPLPLKAGRSVNAAVTEALAAAGFAAGHVRLDGIAIEPMRYVMPAPAPDDAHVAWYSDTFAPPGRVTVGQAAAIVGTRDGEPFIHCHGTWREGDGRLCGGHLLPHEAVLAEDAVVPALGIDGAAFVARDDAETNFRLFSAEPASPGGSTGARRGIACTVRPNGDIGHAIAAVCARHGIAEGSVYGVGSLVGVDFADGRHVASYATEVMIREGRVSGGTCTLDVVLVGLDGVVHEGVLARDTNPVCVTFELVIVEDQPAAPR